MEGEDEEVVMVAGVVFEQAGARVCVCVCLSVRSRCSQRVRENGRLNLRSADWPIRDCFLVTRGSQFTLPFSLALHFFLFTLILKCFRYYCCPVCLFSSIFLFFFFSSVCSLFLVFLRLTPHLRSCPRATLLFLPERFCVCVHLRTQSRFDFCLQLPRCPAFGPAQNTRSSTPMVRMSSAYMSSF